jgi:hypothetical protein
LSIEGVHHEGGAVGGSNLKTYARVVKLKLKFFLFDFSATRNLQRAAGDQLRDRFDVWRRRTIAGERRHLGTNTIVHALQKWRRFERRQQIERLARAQDLDRDDARR